MTDQDSDPAADPTGSLWRRWDPHLHAPGTLFNDQFGGESSWDDFLTRLETSTPLIEALGVTDYLSLDTYERVRAAKDSGRLPGVGLIFPNVEMRFAVTAGKGSPINFHLLVSPEADDHVARAKRLLLELTFEYKKETYRCSTADLIRLGKAFDTAIIDDGAALQAGAGQFKVDPDQLLEALRGSDWAQTDVLIAIAGSRSDGTAQLQADGSLTALRRKLETAAHIIFASQPKQREFWLGQGAATLDQLVSDFGGPKPCLHGSDAHALETVGKPDLDRFTWIKGDLAFDALRQACLEPGGRAFIGSEPPRGGADSNTLTSIQVSGADWIAPSRIPLNPGLVAVIGARGSGKTALVEMIAAAAVSADGHLNERSFLRRAAGLLADVDSAVAWGDGSTTQARLAPASREDVYDTPRVQYLSQQFVDQLCSADGLAEELVGEIERVVYQSHPSENRLGAEDFGALLDLKAARARNARARQREALTRATAALATERALKDNLAVLVRQRDEKREGIERDKKDRQALIANGQEDRVKRHEAVSAALNHVRTLIDQANRKRQSLQSLRDDVADFRTRRAPQDLEELKDGHADATLTPEQWAAFGLRHVGDVDQILLAETRAVDAVLATLRGPAANEPELPESLATASPLLADDAVLETQTFSLLTKELTRISALIGIDTANSRKYAQLTEKISKAQSDLEKAEVQVKAAEAAPDRIKVLLADRSTAYKGVIQAIHDEQQTLEELYAPLSTDLGSRTGTLQKLSFSVRRSVDVDAWAAQGEALLDLRTAGPFRGAGSLRAEAVRLLLPAWQTGDAEAVSAAMTQFRETHEAGLAAHRQGNDRAEVRAWGERISAWLYGTDHIQLNYGIQYEGVDIQQLSPGTRGIVLLLLYLAVDRDDDRPLIIDQPEENLDPKSIFDELVTSFREAKARRQIIIVTHNANLVVNTDADQVIVAHAGVHRLGKLPEMTYVCGGLENPVIRKEVCDILEGGAAAFKERARRLRVRLGA